MKPTMLSFFYHNAMVNFDFNALNSNMMINATQMSKIFDKRVDSFLRNDFVKSYIEILKKLPKDEKLWSEFTQICVNSTVKDIENDGQFPPFGVNSDVVLLQESDILQTRGHQGTWMHRLLAIEFAAWLDPGFKLWINLIVENLIFGHYKKHYEAHALQEETKKRMAVIKQKLTLKGNHELTLEYFECDEILKRTTNEKKQASRQNVNLFNYLQQQN